MATIYPHLTSTGPSPTHHEVAARYREIFDERVAQGVLRPFVLPYHLYGVYILAAYLCIPHTKRPWVYSARWGVLVVMVWWQCKTWFETSSGSPAIAFAAGLIAVWGIMWTLTWLVWCRPQFDAKRVQRRRVVREGKQVASMTDGDDGSNGSVLVNGSTTGKESTKLKSRTQSNGHSRVDEHTNGIGGHKSTASESPSGEWEYYWQAYPDNLKERIFWVLDLILNFRGPGWNWAIPPLPSNHPSMQVQLGEPITLSSKTGISSTGLLRFDTRDQLIAYRIPKFLLGYLLLDILKTTMMKDPYFIFGPTTYLPPPYLQHLSPSTLTLYRRTLSSIAIVTSLEMVFTTAPILFSLLLRPSLLGLRAEPWYYPSTWGSLSSVLDKGLNGLWGSWWHQTFRFAFAAPTNWAIRNKYVGARDVKTRVLALLCAFGISGLLHTGGSITQIPKTYPWHAPVFFTLQALGILLQTSLSHAFHPLFRNFPKWLRRSGNAAFAFIWLYYTGAWLIDDFARGGIWLYEPLPVSPLRALGFGVSGDRWWCWEHIGVGWYTGKHWWESGVAL